MADEEINTPGAAKGWTDSERVALLVRLLAKKGGPDWKSFEPPPGRTKKACLHVWGKLKEEAKKAGWDIAADGEVATPNTTPKGKKRNVQPDEDETPTKRAKKEQVAKNEPQDD